MERRIPIRFVQMPPCDPNGPGRCDDNATWESLLQSVQDANRVWRAAGVQFWIRAIDRYYMPTFASMTETQDELPWSTVKTELTKPFSSNLWAWQETEPKWKGDWLRSIAAIYAPASEITVWLKLEGAGGHQTWMPEAGRSVVMHGPGMAGQPYKLAHELGHYVGLVHTWEDNGFHDPSTMTPWKRSDYWDLVYKSGFGFTYYNSRASAAADEASLELIERHPCPIHCGGWAAGCTDLPPGCNAQDCKSCTNCGNCPCWCGCGCTECGSCQELGAGYLECHVGDGSGYWEQWFTTDPALKGLAFAFADGFGPNVMSYTGNFQAYPYGVSDSQIEMVRKQVRWDVPLDTDVSNLIYRGYRYSQDTLSGRRPDLGNWNPRNPAHKLDFDGDGKRDLGIWLPPTTLSGTGQFKVLLSSQNFSQAPGQFLSVSLGGLGDIPVPANYADNPGDVARTDVAVFQPGGGINRDAPQDIVGWWRWCKTSSPGTSCTMATPFNYGARFDVPQPGLDFDGVAPDELSVYRPSEGNWYAAYSGFGWVKQISYPNSGAVPLGGLYDCDGLADLGVYEPHTAKFILVQSSASWSLAQKITRQFDTRFIPMGSGTASDRCGAMPVPGFFGLRLCQVGQLWIPLPRLQTALWFPQDGTWNMTDPLSGGTTSCGWGISGDMPVPAVDGNRDGRTDMVVYRATSFDQNATLYFKNVTGVVGDCNGGTNALSAGTKRPRQRVFGVADMTGDGKSEILIVEPEGGIVRWLTSESGYTSGSSASFGTSAMEVL